MARLIDSIATGRRPVWLDSTDYVAQLLAAGKVPWTDAPALLAWLRKGQGLLRSDVIGVPLAAIEQGWLSSHPPLLAAMRARRRPLAPLRALLADEQLRAHLLELMHGLRAAFDDRPLVLCLPSPRLWPGLAYRQAFGGEAVEIGDDDADGAAMYIADFLRSFGDAGLDALLLEEAVSSAPESADDIELYRPVLNVARHYRWDLALLTPVAPAFDASAVDVVIAPGSAAAWLGDDFWRGGGAADAGLRYARVPPGLQPEAVLDRIAVLR